MIRSWLVNAMAGIKLNIWYELQDGSGSASDTESHFGVLHRNNTPKLAYVAAQTGQKWLGKAQFIRRVPVPGFFASVFLLQFSDERYAVWSDRGEQRIRLPLKLDACIDRINSINGARMAPVCGDNALVDVGATPVYLIHVRE